MWDFIGVPVTLAGLRDAETQGGTGTSHCSHVIKVDKLVGRELAICSHQGPRPPHSHFPKCFCNLFLLQKERKSKPELRPVGVLHGATDAGGNSPVSPVFVVHMAFSSIGVNNIALMLLARREYKCIINQAMDAKISKYQKNQEPVCAQVCIPKNNLTVQTENDFLTAAAM